MLQLGGSLLAVLALVLLTWMLGFRQVARLESEDEARELMRLAPGGFEPVTIALDRHGSGAIGRDAQGRLLILWPHGSQFVARALEPGESLQAEDGMLHIVGARRIALDLGELAEDWTVADSAVN